MNIKRIFKVLFLCLIPCLSSNLHAMDGSPSQQDPLARMNYRLAFDQKKIHQKFSELMHQWNCAENVFDSAENTSDTVFVDIPEEQNTETQEYMPLNQEETEESTNDDAIVINISQDQEAAYQTACLKKLQGARRWAITEEAREAMITLGLLGGAATTLNLMLPTDSMGGSFSVFAAVFNAAFLMRPIIRSGCNLAVPPANPLEHLEELFALNQCFIPKKLWPIIKEKFILARTNQFQQEDCMRFLDFALGLTLHQKKLPLIVNGSLAEKKRIILEKVDQFFEEYNITSPTDLWQLKDNISKFIDCLVSETQIVDPDNAPQYLHLFGPGGIGKTYFINELCTLIEELIPNSVKIEKNLPVSDATTLEGDAHCTGAILGVLRNQLMHKKHGSVVFFDEATWLNDRQIVSAAKRVFNGDQSKLSAKYFGTDVDGSGTKLPTPPMLIFAASNDKITDEHLKTRFACIDFPLPKKERLAMRAKEIASKSDLIASHNINLESFNFEEWIEQTKITNFRDAAYKIVPAILSKVTDQKD